MSISSIDQNFTNDDDYLFTFLNNEVSNSLEYSSTNSESSSPQATTSSSPENCSWELFEFESDFLPQVKKEDKFSNSNCLSNLYPSVAGQNTKINNNSKESGKKRTLDELLGDPDVKCLANPKVENSNLPNIPARTISIEEEKKIKKQRRLIKNRESAQLSRLRKKQYIENLENQVKKLANDNAILNKHIETVQSQNLALQEEVLYLRGIINQKQDQNLPNIKARNTATAGVCLLLILFSFGLFFNQSQNNSSSPLALPSAPSVPQTFYKGLTLKEQPPPLPEPPKIDQTSLQPQAANDLEPKRKRAKIQVINEEEDDLVISTPRSTLSSTPPNAISSLSESTNMNMKPSNNSYIYCPEAHQFVNEETPTSSDNFEFPIVSILLPSVSLNGILPEINDHISNPEQTLLEVSCKILNINVYPFFPDVSSGSIVPPIHAIGSL